MIKARRPKKVQDEKNVDFKQLSNSELLEQMIQANLKKTKDLKKAQMDAMFELYRKTYYKPE